MDEAWGQLVRGSGMLQNSDTTGGEVVQSHSVDEGRREMAHKVPSKEMLIADAVCAARTKLFAGLRPETCC